MRAGRLPRTLMLAGKRWRVRIVRDLVNDDGEDVEGLCFKERRVIMIDADQTPVERASTLVHEVIHALFPEGVVGYRTEERIVAALEAPILAALPELARLVGRR